MQCLWAITSYFNPASYRLRRENYLAFRRHLDVPLVTVELAYRDAFELPDDAADILIRLRGTDVLWQKERLLNLALMELPPQCDSVAWLDCDVVFDRGGWWEHALRALDRFPLLQPFTRVYEPTAAGWDPAAGIPREAALGSSIAHLFATGGLAPEILLGNMRTRYRAMGGLAWVARRDLLERDGLYDACVVGSGNRAMLCGALGQPSAAIEFLQMNPAWAEHYRVWAERHFRSVRAKIGCIEGTVVHLRHGDLGDRRYAERHRGFSVHRFDPVRDIALDEGGCWRWSTEKPAMHAYVADYFLSRREDGVRASDPRTVCDR